MLFYNLNFIFWYKIDEQIDTLNKNICYWLLYLTYCIIYSPVKKQEDSCYFLQTVLKSP